MPLTRCQLQDRSGCPYWIHRVGDRIYPDFRNYVNGDYGTLLHKVKHLEMRPDDVIVSAFPKSGNHWVYELLHMVVSQTTEYAPGRFDAELMDLKTTEELDRFTDNPSPRHLFTHLNVESLPAQIVEKKSKVIYVVRNIKDVAVSMHCFTTSLKEFLVYKGNWTDFLDLFLHDKLTYGTWLDHVRQADLFRKKHPRVPFHVLCYELLKTNPVEEISKLCKFLGETDKLAEEIAVKMEFSAMKTALKPIKLDMINAAFCEPGTSGLLRKGVIGDWHGRFSVAQNETVDQMIKEQLQDSPIASLLKPYM